MKMPRKGTSHSPPRPETVLEPRKTPTQARSAASVDAILDATLQVLVKAGKERMTTTRVALRAGVSVGTLYQYFPNKSALLQAVLRRHMDQVSEAVERVCREQRGNGASGMAAELIHAFLGTKMREPRASAALYAVSSSVDGVKIAQRASERLQEAMVEMFRTAREPLARDPRLVAATLLAAMAGVSRRLLESEAPEEELGTLREELVFLSQAYLDACGDGLQGRSPVAGRREERR